MSSYTNVIEKNITKKMTMEKLEQMTDYFIKPSELFDILRISNTAGYSLIYQNLIPAQKYGKSYRIKRVDALRIIKEGISTDTTEKQ